MDGSNPTAREPPLKGNGDQWGRIWEIFHEALGRDAGARSAWLDEECGSDTGLRAEVEALLAAHDGAERALEPAANAATATNDPALVGKRVGAYAIRGVLGEGGFAVVYDAEQKEPVRRDVALKILKPGMDTKRVLARFEAERQALALMDHPNVARVYDAGVTETGRPYFVMERVGGVPLTEHCDERRLDVPTRLALFVDVCRAVQHAHYKGILHRDLKPSNVLVSDVDGEATVKVIDFGVAKAIGEPLTPSGLQTIEGQLVGTPEYMSPEQAQAGSGDIDTRTDVYSLGVVMYELLTGTLPHGPTKATDLSFAQLRRLVREEDPPTPSTRVARLGDGATPIALKRRADARSLRRGLRGELDWIVMRAMDKDRTRRYGTTAELAADIERALRHEPVCAGPPGVAYRLRKAAKRHRKALVASVAVVVLTLTTTGYALRARTLARRAEWHQTVALLGADRSVPGVFSRVRDAYERFYAGLAAGSPPVERRHLFMSNAFEVNLVARPFLQRGDPWAAAVEILPTVRLDYGELGLWSDVLVELRLDDELIWNGRRFVLGHALNRPTAKGELPASMRDVEDWSNVMLEAQVEVRLWRHDAPVKSSEGLTGWSTTSEREWARIKEELTPEGSPLWSHTWRLRRLVVIQPEDVSVFPIAVPDAAIASGCRARASFLDLQVGDGYATLVCNYSGPMPLAGRLQIIDPRTEAVIIEKTMLVGFGRNQALLIPIPLASWPEEVAREMLEGQLARLTVRIVPDRMTALGEPALEFYCGSTLEWSVGIELVD